MQCSLDGIFFVFYVMWTRNDFDVINEQDRKKTNLKHFEAFSNEGPNECLVMAQFCPIKFLQARYVHIVH